jgi:uroporphyrinogen decarboxylase
MLLATEYLGEDTMSTPTAFQRVMAAIELKEPDRVPVVPMVTYTTAQLIGIQFSEALYSAEKMAKALVAGYKSAGYDGIYVGWESSFNLMAEAMGCKLQIQPNNIAFVKDQLIKEQSDLDKIKVADPEQDGRLPLHLKAINLVKEKIGEGVPIFKYVPGPLTLTSILRGQDQLLMDLVRNPKLVYDILKPATESSKRFAVATVEHGTDIVVVADPIASSTVISPKMFDQFALSPIKEVLKAISEVGGIPSLHICGKTRLILERMVDAGTRIIELDYQVDLAFAKNKVGKKVCIEGNIDPVSVLLNGKPNDVKREARECIKKAAKGGGFMLSSGCEVPLNAPFENVKAMVSAAKRYGQYPI